jgi:RNA polymerase sigma-70 factor (ECF subfamily)
VTVTGERIPSFEWTGAAIRVPHSPSTTAAAAPPSSRGNVIALDRERVRLAGEGEPKAQAWLVTRLLPRVRRIARAFLKRNADADDAAQVALLEILRSASTYRGEASVEGWAKCIAVRAVLRFAQEERRRDRLIDRNDSGEDETAPSELHEDRAVEALPRALREYLGELAEPQRNALILHHALGHSVDEIAEMTEVSPDTVKSRLRLGTAALRKKVQQDIAIGRRRSLG